ncbi:MAG: hypothetical protein ACKVQJ_08940 [Pyrinomonadaceae bacterium]
MRARYIAAIAFILVAVSFLTRQTLGQKTVPKRPSATSAGSNQAAADFEFEVTITPLGLAGIIVRRKSGLGLFTPAMLSSFANQSAKSSLNPSFVIRPDKGAKMADILAAINAIRVSTKTDVRIEVDADLAIFIPKKADPNATPKPNPLFLLVNFDDRSNISLNGENEGSFPDTSKLEQHLRQIFEDRAANGVWRQGTTTTDTTVIIKLAKNLTFANLADLARAVKRAGSDAIGLQIDETDNVLKVEMVKP